MTHNLRDQWWRWGLGLLLIAGISWWLYATFEWHTEEVDIGPTEHARQNPYLALQMFLQSRNTKTEFQRGFSGLVELRLGGKKLGQNDALILTHTFQALQEPQVESLWQWVSHGGTLIVAAHNPHIPATGDLQDNLLERMGLVPTTSYRGDTLEVSENPPFPLDSAENSQDDLADCLDGAVHSLTFPGEAEPLKLRTHAAAQLYADESDIQVLAASDENHSVFTRYALGAGQIYTLAHDFPLRNEYVACNDNGYIAWRMIGESPKAWFAINTDTPSFWSQIWQISPAACLMLLATLGLWIWQQGVRFGPVHFVDRSQRRQFLDHIRANATFLYRNQGNTVLIQMLRDEIQQRMLLKDSHYTQLPPARQLDKLQQATAMSPADLQLAMQAPLPVPNGQLVEVVKRLQNIRNHL